MSVFHFQAGEIICLIVIIVLLVCIALYAYMAVARLNIIKNKIYDIEQRLINDNENDYEQ